MKEEKEYKSTVPQWIKNLQENSWELELLISGGVIFSLFKLANVFLEFCYMIKMTSAIPGINAIIILGMLAIKILTVGFSVHLLLRAFWLGMVCINYVFPNGIKDKAFKNKIPFKQSYKDGGNLRDEIIGVDKASGIVMYLSIITAMVLAGIILTITINVFIFKVFNLLSVSLATNIISYLFLIYLADLLSFGLFRKIKYLSFILYPFFKFFDIITFRRVYQKSITLFSSNVNKFKAIIGIIILIFASLFFTYTSLYRMMRWPNIIDSRQHRLAMAPANNFSSPARYLDQIQQENFKIIRPIIQSELITTNHLMLFIPYNIAYDDLVNLKDGDVLSNHIQVHIDDSVYTGMHWYNFWAFDNDQIGMKTYIDIKELNRGHHDIMVYFNDKDNWTKINFWKD